MTIKIPHQYQKEDIEICAFFTATIAWGNRLSVIKSGGEPREFGVVLLTQFIMEYESNDIHLFTELLTQMILIFFCRSFGKYTKWRIRKKSFQLYPKQEAKLFIEL